MKSFITFNNVKKTYKVGDVEINASDGVDFEVNKGEFVVIVGPSGAGKTTILNLLGGMDKATSGQILVDGQDVAKYSERQLTQYRRDDIGFVFQLYNLVQNLTALENVELATQISKNPLDVRMVLERVGLNKRLDNFPAQLSGGEQQRIAIARALVNKPAILLCDEPTGNLDPANSNEIMKILNQVNKQGTTVLVVTHNMEIVQQMKKRTITMSEGKIISDQEKGGYFYED